MLSRNRYRAVLTVFALLTACEKVPIQDIGASFSLSDVTWFQDEETMFVFYQVDALQGIGPLSQVELTYRTDDLEQPWVNIADLPKVHVHVPISCGEKSLCGSTSIHVKRMPRDVGVRLRYHRDGALAYESTVTFNAIGSGPPNVNRSLVLYGVFDETNSHLQWRARHQFPTLRNQQVQDFGLRRFFRVESPGFGAWPAELDGNPYGYGFASTCPSDFTPLNWAVAATTTRAMFAAETVPVAAFDAAAICGLSTVTDAKGTFSTAVVAQKNPQTRAAFPALRSPIKENTKIGFTLEPCNRVIDAAHLAMQQQRLLIEGGPMICTDNWQAPDFVDTVVSTLRTAIDTARAGGADMVLALALNHDDTTGQFDAKVEAALAQILPPEKAKSSPRVSGAFVFDSLAHAIAEPKIARLALWCPANLSATDLDTTSATSLRSCPVVPDIPDLMLGPIKFNQAPILPTRAQYDTFIGKYSVSEAGSMTALHFLAPERTPTSADVPIGDFGDVTFFNTETFAAAPTDAFSFCTTDDSRLQFVAARVAAAPDMPFPISSLPDVQNSMPQPTYELGIGWDFPFLLRLEYQKIVGGAVSAFSFSVPFGIASPAMAYYGNELWQNGEIPLSAALSQCTRFCDAPTFDSAGVYNVGSLFRATYAQQCFRPLYPVFDAAHLSDGGFPLDP